jgi:GTP-binding protein
VLNKVDLLPEGERDARCQAIIDAIGWQGPVYRISAISNQGTEKLCFDIMEFVEQQKQELCESESENQSDA